VVALVSFEYLSDQPNISAQLDGLLKQTDAYAIMLVQERACRTAVGNLSQPALQEISHLLVRYILSSSTRDLTRSFRLESDKSEYSLYATRLGEEWRIGVIFSPTISFTQMRSQALFIRRELATPRVIPLPAQVTPAPVPATQPVETAPSPDLPDLAEKTRATEPETDMWSLPLTLNDLLASMPSPDPEPGAIITQPMDDWQPSNEPPSAPPAEPAPTPPAEPVIEVVSPPVVTVEPASTQPVFVQPQAIQPSLIPEVPASTVYLERHMGFSTAVDVSSQLEDTRPLPVSIVRTNTSAIEPGYPAMANLAYTSVLVPRQPQHFLTGPYASQLSDWMPQICTAFGWRLDSLSIRPDYMQWTVQVNPTISPGNVVRIIRQYTSQRLITQFSQSRLGNSSGDFWASGYLIVSGMQSPSPQLLRDFINQTRRRQGFSL
jgi:REP element-mobilizing transposase RayT